MTSSNNTSHSSSSTVLKNPATPHSKHVGSSSMRPGFSATVDEVDEYIDADIGTGVSKEFDEFLKAMLGEDMHLVDQKDPILEGIAVSPEMKALREKYCDGVTNESERYGPFCELVNYIISQLPGQAQRESFVFCRNDPHNVKGVFNNSRKPDVVVLSSQHPSVADGSWKNHSRKGPRKDSWTWLDIQHVFEFKLYRNQISYNDEATSPELKKQKASNESTDGNMSAAAIPVVALPVISLPSVTGSSAKPSSHAAPSKRRAPQNQRILALSGVSHSTTKSSKKRRREDEDDDVGSSESSKRSRDSTHGDRVGEVLMKQSTRYAIDKLSFVPNLRHAISGLVQDGHLWMCYYDHSCIVCSTRFTFVSDLYKFVLLIKAIVELSPSDRGIIKGFKKYDPEDFDDTYIELSRASSPADTVDDRPAVDTRYDSHLQTDIPGDHPALDTSDGSLSQEDVSDDHPANVYHLQDIPGEPPAPDTFDASRLQEDILDDPTSIDGSDGSDQESNEDIFFPEGDDDDSPKWSLSVGSYNFLVRNSLTGRRPYGLIGRASRVNAATCGTLIPSCPNKVYALKTSWPVKMRRKEQDIIALARSVLKDLDGDEKFKKISNRQISDCLPQVFMSCDLDDVEDNEFRSRLNVSESTVERVFRVIAFDHLYTNYRVKSVDLFKQLFREVFQGHHFLFNSKHIIKHGDISLENIMFRIMPDDTVRGVLNDWDLAKVGNSVEDSHTKGTRTGTRPFMACDLLTDYLPDHIERFDWESFFYVLYWIASHYSGGRDVNPKALVTWLDSNMERLLAIKTVVLSGMQLAETFTDDFMPLVETWLRPLQNLFHDGHYARKAVAVAIQRGALAQFNSETFDGHITYEKVWTILKN